uniref:Carbonate dehydratase n=1 Tax=Griffithsia japonica TaxID=83288 RepID=Q7XZA2_GRIJA|nr:carbonate dehydratase [Griffithsia japonica]
MISTVSVFLFFALVATAFAASGTAYVADKQCAEKGGTSPDTVSYSYDMTVGENGPGEWGDSEEFSTCKTGQIQSPIDFPTEVQYGMKMDGPMPNISVSDFEMSAGSFNWALNCKESQTCGYTMFETYDADAYPVRVYENANMLYGTNPFLKSMLNNVAKGKQEFPVHLGSIIDASKGYCSYVGSLTTPPCTEGVTFMMAQKVQMMNPKQAREYLRTAGACVDGNARPIQELNGRQVTCYIK